MFNNRGDSYIHNNKDIPPFDNSFINTTYGDLKQYAESVGTVVNESIEDLGTRFLSPWTDVETYLKEFFSRVITVEYDMPKNPTKVVMYMVKHGVNHGSVNSDNDSQYLVKFDIDYPWFGWFIKIKGCAIEFKKCNIDNNDDYSQF